MQTRKLNSHSSLEYPGKDCGKRESGKRELERMLGKVFARRFWLYRHDLLKVKVRTYL